MRYLTIMFVATVVSLSLMSCEGGLPGMGGDARSVLDRFCRLKQSAIAQVLLSPQQMAAGRIVCGAIGEGMGNPG
jgi:hypothetical protein